MAKRRKPAPNPIGLPFMRLYRERADKMSQEDLADRVGVTQGMISQWEKGTSDVPLGMIYRLAKALDTTPEALLFRNPFVPQQQILEMLDRVPLELQDKAVRILKGLID